MANRVGLYEYLAENVATASVETTRVTEAPETFDDDAGLVGLGVDPSSTGITHVDGETYDDDPEIASLNGLSMSTTVTRVDGETYDDDAGIGDLASLGNLSTDRTGGVPDETVEDRGFELLADLAPLLESTSFTKVDGETIDDDSGISGLGDP